MRRLLSIVLLAGGILTAQDADTQRLARDLGAARGWLMLTVPQFKLIQQDLLDWTDTRIQRGFTQDQLNAELEQAGLFAPDALYKSDDIYQPSPAIWRKSRLSACPVHPI